jgi:methionyl-tRNA formyltransferase
MAFGKRLGVEWAEPVRDAAGAPGEITATGRETVDVACGEGLLRLATVKPEGKKTMSAGAWARGARITEGMRLE